MPKRIIKGGAAHVPGAERALKWAWVEARRVGERIAFAWNGPPASETAILLASSGRSGSTWLGDILAATPGTQQIFEPLDPRNAATYRQLMAWPPGLTPSAFKRQYLRPQAHAPQWEAFWEAIFQGRVRTYLTDYHRTSFFPRRFLIKVIRANMMLGFVASHFHPRIVFLMRHPAAVVNSMYHRVKAPWPADARDVLAQEALVEDFLRPWVAQIEQTPPGLPSLALWWAVENKVALNQLAHYPHYLVFYEHLSLDPRGEITPLLTHLGLPPESIPEPLLYRYSRMTSTRQRRAGAQDAMTRLQAWQKELSPEEQRWIFSWLERLEIPCYGTEVLPRCPSGPRNRP